MTMRTAWQYGSVAPMRADAALARLSDVSHRSASLLAATQRTVTQPDAAHAPRFTSDGEWLCSGACGSGWRWHRGDRKRHAMCSKPPGVDFYNWSAVRVFVGEHGGSRCGSRRPYCAALHRVFYDVDHVAEVDDVSFVSRSLWRMNGIPSRTVVPAFFQNRRSSPRPQP